MKCLKVCFRKKDGGEVWLYVPILILVHGPSLRPVGLVADTPTPARSRPRAELQSKTRDQSEVEMKMGLRWWRDVLILSQPKRYLDDRQARKYWHVSFGKIR